ncbi:hypothetical protein GCM10009820_05790 [Leifsonia soli]
MFAAESVLTSVDSEAAMLERTNGFAVRASREEEADGGPVDDEFDLCLRFERIDQIADIAENGSVLRRVGVVEVDDDARG